jgi:hypothetical protein
MPLGKRGVRELSFLSFFVMPALDPGTHAVTSHLVDKPMELIARLSQAMTKEGCDPHQPQARSAPP